MIAGEVGGIFRIHGLGFRVSGVGFRVEGLKGNRGPTAPGVLFEIFAGSAHAVPRRSGP